MKKWALLLSIVVLVGSPWARAWEDTRLLGINSYSVFPADIKNEQGQIGTTGVGIGGIVPFELAEQQSLVLGAAWQGLFIDYGDVDFSWMGPGGIIYTDDELPDALHAISMTLGYSVEFDSGFGLFGAFIPAIHSDFEDVGSEDIYYLGGLVGNYQIDEDLNLLLGLYYADSFGEEMLLPGLGVQWVITPELTLDAFLPQYLTMEWELDPRFSLGLRGRLVGHEYRMTKDQPWDDTVLKYSQILTGPFLDVNLIDALYLRLEGGVAFARVFEIREKDGPGKLDDGDLDPQGYVSGALFVEY